MLRILDDENSVESLVTGILGNIIGFGLNLTPFVLFYELYKGKRRLKDIPEMMFISGVFCGSSNLAYGIIKNNKMLYIPSIVNDSLQIFYSTIFLFLYSNKKISTFLLYIIIAYDLTFEEIYIFVNVLEFHWGYAVAESITGGVNSTVTVINAITPGQNIIKVFKTEDFTLIPIVTNIFQCLCSTFWAIYGFILMDKWMIIPNVFGSVLALVQIATYFYFYCKRNGKPPEREEKNKIKDEYEEEDEDKDNKNEDQENQINLIDKNKE